MISNLEKSRNPELNAEEIPDKINAQKKLMQN